MTTAQTIINSAYYELNIVGIGETPTTAQSAVGLTRLNEVLGYILGGTAGEFLQPWPLGNHGRESSDYIFPSQLQLANPVPNVTLIQTAVGGPSTIYFPAGRGDGARMAVIDPYSRLAANPLVLDGNGVTIESAATVTVNTNGLRREWIYRADTGNWLRIQDLSLSSDVPFPAEFDLYLYLSLAFRLQPPAGVKVSDFTMQMFQRVEKKFQARYIQQAPLKNDPSLDFMTWQSYDSFFPYPYGSQTYFDVGYAWWPGW